MVNARANKDCHEDVKIQLIRFALHVLSPFDQDYIKTAPVYLELGRLKYIR